MRILSLHNDYLIAGGETLTVHEQATALRARGHDVHVVQVDNSRIAGGTGARNAAAALYSSAAWQLVRQGIDAFDPDVVHSHNLFPFLGSGAVRAIAASGRPWVQHVHNYRMSCLSANHFRAGEDCHECSSSATAVRGVRHGCYRGSRAASLGVLGFDASRRWAQALTRGPDLYLAVSATMRERVQRSLGSVARVGVAYNGIDTARVPPETPRAGRRGVIMVGRLTPEKGTHLAMQALDALSEVPATVIGDGPLSQEVARWAAGRPQVTLLTGLTSDQVLDRLAGAAVSLVLPLWDEPFGRTVVESTAVGTPVVATPRGALPELAGKLTGITLVEPSAQAVADAVRAELDRTTAESEELAMELRRRTAESFDLGVTTEALVEHYRTAVAAADGRRTGRPRPLSS